MIDICYVGTGVNYLSLSYWSFVMMSPVDFSAGEFCAKQNDKSFKWQLGKK